MMCMLSLPITPVTNVYKNWYFGKLLCHLIPCIQGLFSFISLFHLEFLGISIFICTFSLSAIAVDRYKLVSVLLLIIQLFPQITSGSNAPYSSPNQETCSNRYILPVDSIFRRNSALRLQHGNDRISGRFLQEAVAIFIDYLFNKLLVG